MMKIFIYKQKNMGTILTILFFALGGLIILLAINAMTGEKILKGNEVRLFIIGKYLLYLLLILIIISKVWTIE
jgi:hypothetical protein